MSAPDDRAGAGLPVPTPNVSQCRCSQATYPQSAILHIWRPGLGCPSDRPYEDQPAPAADDERQAADELTRLSQEMGLYDDQPAPAGDDELRHAERVLRNTDDWYYPDVINAAMTLMAEYDERGRERDAARANEAELMEAYARLGDALDIVRSERDAARAEVERLRTWAGLMSLLDEHYPSDVMTGESGDPGPRIVALVREMDQLRGWYEKRARNVHEFIAFPRAEQGEQKLAEFAEDVARIILGEEP